MLSADMPQTLARLLIQWLPLLSACAVAAPGAGHSGRLVYEASGLQAGQRIVFSVDAGSVAWRLPGGEAVVTLDRFSGRLKADGLLPTSPGWLDESGVTQLGKALQLIALDLQAQVDAAAPENRERTRTRLLDMLQPRNAWSPIEQTTPQDPRPDTGRVERVGGLPCRVVLLQAGSTPVGEACVTDAAAVPGGPALVGMLNELDRVTLRLRQAVAGTLYPSPPVHALVAAARDGALPLRVTLTAPDTVRQAWTWVPR